jgi:hypothetical protein
MYRDTQLLLRWKVKLQPVYSCAVDYKRGRIPSITCHKDTDGQSRYSFIFTLTSALEGSAWLTPRPCRCTSGIAPVTFVRQAWWAPRPVWTGAQNSPHLDSIPDRPARSE